MRRNKPTGLPGRINWDSDYVPERRPLTEQAAPDTQPRWIGRALLGSAVILLALAAGSVYLKFRPLAYHPVRWQEAGGFDRGRMLASLLDQTGFVGFTRPEVEHYLGLSDFDERQFWYDLGPISSDLTREARADVGEEGRLSAVFFYVPTGAIDNVLYSYRRPTFGSAQFDSAGWFSEDRSVRQTMFTHGLRQLRAMGMNRATTRLLFGPPDGHRVRAHYDVGMGGAFIGSGKALILSYDDNDTVISMRVAE